MSEFRRRNHGGGHSYYLGDRKLDGVTTILNKGLPKPALVRWAARTAAELAVNDWDRLAQLPVADRLRELADAPNAARDAAAIRGTRIHALADPLARGEEIQVPDELAGHVESCLRFLSDWDVQERYTECPVYHDRYLYAGTLDMIADVNGETWLLDWKTSASGAYGDTAFQLAAYANATHMLDHGQGPDGILIPMPHIDRCGVIWLRSDGYELYPYHVDEHVFRQFLYIQQTARAADDCRQYKGDALTPPVRSTP